MTELDRAVLEDRRAGDVGIGGESVPGRFERLALEQQPDPEHGPEAQPPLDVGGCGC